MFSRLVDAGVLGEGRTGGQQGAERSYYKNGAHGHHQSVTISYFAFGVAGDQNLVDFFAVQHFLDQEFFGEGIE
jgi:hypothetical protein